MYRAESRHYSRLSISKTLCRAVEAKKQPNLVISCMARVLICGRSIIDMMMGGATRPSRTKMFHGWGGESDEQSIQLNVSIEITGYELRPLCSSLISKCLRIAPSLFTTSVLYCLFAFHFHVMRCTYTYPTLAYTQARATHETSPIFG